MSDPSFPAPSTISELMALDPFKCNDLQIAEIVKIFRENRKQFQLGALKAPAKKPVAKKLSDSLSQIDLDI